MSAAMTTTKAIILRDLVGSLPGDATKNAKGE